MKFKIKEALRLDCSTDLTYVRNTYVRETKVIFECSLCKRLYQGILRYLPNALVCKQCNIDNTKLNKYGSKTYNNPSKAKETNFQKYGVESWSQTTEAHDILSKSMKTLSHRTAVKNALNSRTKADWEHTQELKNKNAILKYGSLENFHKYCQQKHEEGCYKKYGIKNAGALNAEKEYIGWGKYKYNDRVFDSSWELAYYIWLQDHNIDFEYHNGFYFEYVDDLNMTHRYYPDFKINNEWYEIKSNYLWDFNKQCILNQDRTINIAKTLCLLNNKVHLLFEKDIKPYLKYIKETYGKNYLQLFKAKRLSQ